MIEIFGNQRVAFMKGSWNANLQKEDLSSMPSSLPSPIKINIISLFFANWLFIVGVVLLQKKL